MRVSSLQRTVWRTEYGQPYELAFPEDTILDSIGKKAGSYFDPVIDKVFHPSLLVFREILGQFADQAAAA